MLLQKRNNFYYFRYSFPPEVRIALGRRELCKTLHTRNKIEAHAKSAIYLPFVLSVKQIHSQLNYLTSQQYKKQLEQAYEQLENRLQMSRLSHLGGSVRAFHGEYANTSRVRFLEKEPLRIESMASQGVSFDDDNRTESLLLSDAYQNFISFKSLAPKIVECYSRHIKTLHLILGDPCVSSITKRQLKGALSVICKLPKKNIKPYNTMTLKQIFLLDDIPEEHYISPKSVKEHLKFWQSLFAYLSQETHHINKSPTLGLKYAIDTRKASYAPLSSQEVIGLLSLAKQSKDYWMYILFLLAAYTGARKSELLALTVSDFKIDDDTGRNYFVVNKSKTPAGIRKVPLSKCIVKEVSSYLHSIQEREMIFPEGEKYNKRFTNIIRSFLKVMGKGTITDSGRRKVFHSFRHTFITEARSKGVELSLVQSVVGHELSNTGQTQIYTNEYPLRAVLCVVDSIQYQPC